MQYFGIRLKRLREARDLTQTQLAEKLGLVKATISAYEQSRTYPSIDVLVRICTFFDVSADEMLGLSKDHKIVNSYLTDGQMIAVRNLVRSLEEDNIARGKQSGTMG